MADKLTGYEPAFPLIDMADGISIRQYFAAKALQGFTSLQNKGDFDTHDQSAIACAHLCLKYADALIAALNETTKP